jgi:hypothetical protein
LSVCGNLPTANFYSILMEQKIASPYIITRHHYFSEVLLDASLVDASYLISNKHEIDSVLKVKMISRDI